MLVKYVTGGIQIMVTHLECNHSLSVTHTHTHTHTHEGIYICIHTINIHADIKGQEKK